MKLKAVVHDGCDSAIVTALESDEFRNKVLDQVLCRYLHVGNIGPAEFYVQKCDFSGTKPMCAADLTRVSGIVLCRSGQSFLDARDELEALYRETILKYELPSDLQLMVSISLDQRPETLKSNLVERNGEPAIWLRKQNKPFVRTRGN